MKEKIQSFGRFLSGMVMPNIGAFIAWGLLAALFISSGWIPNEHLAALVNPMLNFVLPLLIAYTGGKMVAGDRGAVMAAIATIGVIQSGYNPSDGSYTTMLMGAMIMGPFAGWVIKMFDKAVDGHIKPGFEMLVNNFSIGIIGLILMIIGYNFFGPFMEVIMHGLSNGANWLVNHGLLPLVSIVVEPAKVLFLNNAINHGIFTPLGLEQAQQTGKSIFYMIEPNPGPGTGVLLAYWLFSKDKATKQSAPGALIVHLLGGVHEISFPYILMNPLLLIATISGSLVAMIYNTALGLGLSGPASPGSIFAFVGMAPKGSTVAVLFSVVIATAVSFVIASPIVRLSGAKGSLEDAQNQMDSMKAQSKGQAVTAPAQAGDVDLRTLDHIVFACDAGMGSSAMGAAVLQKKLEAAGLSNIKVTHSSVSEVPAGTKFVVCHQDLVERAKKSAPQARIVTINNFMTAPEYDEIVNEIVESRENKHSEKPAADNYHGGVLIKKNIRMNLPSTHDDGSKVTKNEVIRAIGQALVDTGYVTPKYIDGMIAKEDVFNTAIGNSLAIPHGIESSIGEIKNSGLAIFTYPDGIDWGDGETVKLIIAVASAGDDHVETLGKIAAACESQEAVDAILKKSVDEVYDMFKD